MKKQLFWSLVPLLLMASVPAGAVDEEVDRKSPVSVISREDLSSAGMTLPEDLINALPKNTLGVNAFYQDVHALQPSSGPGTISIRGGSVVGLGVDYTLRPNVNSGFYLRGTGAYGIGSEKTEVSGTFGFTDKVSITSIYGSASGGIIMPITRRTGVYGQAGAFYSTTKATLDDGTDEFDGEPFKVFGLDTAVGVRWSVGGKNHAFIEQYSQFGWGSGEDGDDKYNETVKYGCFRGGYAFGF